MKSLRAFLYNLFGWPKVKIDWDSIVDEVYEDIDKGFHINEYNQKQAPTSKDVPKGGVSWKWRNI